MPLPPLPRRRRRRGSASALPPLPHRQHHLRRRRCCRPVLLPALSAASLSALRSLQLTWSLAWGALQKGQQERVKLITRMAAWHCSQCQGPQQGHMLRMVKARCKPASCAACSIACTLSGKAVRPTCALLKAWALGHVLPHLHAATKHGQGISTARGGRLSMRASKHVCEGALAHPHRAVQLG